MIDPKNPYARHYASLSVKDLLDAREAYHVHLMQMENVFATAIGLYRIRHDDLDYHSYHPAGDANQGARQKNAAANYGKHNRAAVVMAVCSRFGQGMAEAGRLCSGFE